MPEHTIHFLPSGQKAAFEDGTNIRDAALELGIIIESTCAGIGTCAKCKVKMEGGVSPLSEVERQLLAPYELAKGMRLSCQARLTGDAVCVVPQESQIFGMQIMTEGRRGRFPLNPDLRKKVASLPEPSIGDKYFDFSVLLRELNLPPQTDLGTIRDLPFLLRDNNFTVTAVMDGERLVTVEPGDTTGHLYGVAVDIGTTTVVAKLIDLTTGEGQGIASALNAQRPYGADVVARVNYCVEHQGGLELLHRLVVKQINELVAEVCAKAGVSAGHIYKLVLVGNTVMQHLALNIDPRNVAFMPYVPPFQGPATLTASELGFKINRRGVVYVLPNLGSFVGSDITAVLTVLDIDEQDDMQLMVDIGTNGEMVLGSRKRMVCCSSPAGPAWEGAYIAWGMRAARGAIERAEIVDGELQFRTIGNADPIGICGSGLLDLVSEFLRAKVIGVDGRVRDREELAPSVPERLRSRVVVQPNGSNNIALVSLNDEQSIVLAQKDIREVQLAKGAIASGIRVLMETLEVKAGDIGMVSVAGAFGNHVRGQDAIDIGMLPDVSVERVRFIGNAALTGAEAVLLSMEARRKAERLAEFVEYVEISGRPDFQDIFVEAMHFRVGA